MCLLICLFCVYLFCFIFIFSLLKCRVHPRAHTAHIKHGAKLQKIIHIRKKKVKKKPQTAFFSHFICISQKKVVTLQSKTKIESYAKDI